MTNIGLQLDVLSCDITDRGSQRCRLAASNIKLMRAKLGCYVRITCDAESVVCCLWPSTDPDEMCIRYDNTVCVCPHNTGNSECNTGNSSDMPSIEMISASSCTSIKLSIIVLEVSQVQRTKENLRHSNRVKEYCRQCLLNMCVIARAEVNMEDSKLGKCYGFAGFYIHSFESQSHTQGGIINENTEIELCEVLSKEKHRLRKTPKASRLGGLDQQMEKLIEIISLNERSQSLKKVFTDFPRGVLLRGPPGCGKTTLVRQAASVCDAFLVTVNGPEILGSRPGESEENLRNVFEKACNLSEEGSCLLFIDEIDSLCPKRRKADSSQESRVTGQLLALMDGLRTRPRLTVIGATNCPNALDPAIRRPGRFDREVMINIPNEMQRLEILQTLSSCLPLEEDVDLTLLSTWTKGYVGADLSNLCLEAVYLALAETKDKQNSEVIEKIKMNHFKQAFSKIVPSTQRGSDALVDLKPVNWSDIGGLEEVKGQIKQAVEWAMQHPEAFRRMGIPRPRGILLYGPPGCCKTTLVKAAATSCKATFLSVSSAQLFSPFVGDAEKTVTEVFQRARMGAPSILFLDEVDAIAGKRAGSGRQKGVQERLLSTLLNEMDGIGLRLDEKFDFTRHHRIADGNQAHESPASTQSEVEVDNSSVLVVAATNRPDLVDEALLRPGRFDKIIYVPPPDIESRKKILNVHMKKMPVIDVSTEDLAEVTDWYTGADLENLCREAALLSLTQDGLDASGVKMQHFTEALQTVKPSLTVDLVQQFQQLSVRSDCRK